MTNRTPIARWESDGGKYFAELYADQWGYGYTGTNSGGNLGRAVTREADAMAWMEARVAAFPASPTGNYFHPGKRPMKRVDASPDPVAAFLAARPHYDPAHVAEIARACQAEGIPFCAGCNDFHRPDEEHTED